MNETIEHIFRYKDEKILISTIYIKLTNPIKCSEWYESAVLLNGKWVEEERYENLEEASIGHRMLLEKYDIKDP